MLIWLRFSEKAVSKEVHHRDVVGFALTELEREISRLGEQEVLQRFKEEPLSGAVAIVSPPTESDCSRIRRSAGRPASCPGGSLLCSEVHLSRAA